MEIKAVPKGLASRLHETATETVKNLKPEEVLAALKEQGISNLNDLVRETLKYYRETPRHGTGGVGRDTFLFTQFVYKTEGPG